MGVIADFDFVQENGKSEKGEIAFNSYMHGEHGNKSLEGALRYHYNLPEGVSLKIVPHGKPNKNRTLKGHFADNIFELICDGKSYWVLSESAEKLDRSHYSRALDYYSDLEGYKFDVIIYFFDLLSEKKETFFRNVERTKFSTDVDVIYFRTHYKVDNLVCFEIDEKSSSMMRAKILRMNESKVRFRTVGEEVPLLDFLEKQYGVGRKAFSSGDNKKDRIELEVWDQNHKKCSAEIRYEQRGVRAEVLTDDRQIEKFRNQLSDIYSDRPFIPIDQVRDNEDFVIVSNDREDFYKSRLVKLDFHSKVDTIKKWIRECGGLEFVDALRGYTCDNGRFMCVYYAPLFVQICEVLKGRKKAS